MLSNLQAPARSSFPCVCCVTVERLQVFFAGCVATCAANLVLLFILGVHDERVSSSGLALVGAHSVGDLLLG